MDNLNQPTFGETRLDKTRLERSRTEKPRSEIIKAARESCNKNLNPAGKHNKYSAKSMSTYNKPTIKSNNFIENEVHVSPFKSLMARIICAFAIFVTVLTISSLDAKNSTDYSNTLENLITSNTSVEKAEDFLVSLLNKIGD